MDKIAQAGAVGARAQAAGEQNAAGLLQLQEIIVRIINLIVPVAFIILTIMLIVGGFRYLTSGGESKAVQAAGQTMTWALLGILFLALAWVVLLLIKAFTGVDVLTFDLFFFSRNFTIDPVR